MTKIKMHTITTDAAARVSTLTIGLLLRTGRFGWVRHGDMDKVETSADKASLGLLKFLMPRTRKDAKGDAYPEAARAARMAFAAICRHDGRAQDYLRYGIGLPSSLMPGAHRIPVAAVADVEVTLRQWAEERKPLVAAFLALYPALIEAMRGVLTDQWQAADWPKAAEVAAGFRFEWTWFELDEVPARLEGIDPVAAAAAKAALAAKVEQVAADCRAHLRAQALGLVKEVSRRLAGEVDGEPKKFRQSTLLAKLREFLTTAPVRDVTDDSDLQATLGQLATLIAPLDRETLDVVKTDALYQAALKGGFDAVARDLDALTMDASLRVIDFGDEEVA